MKKTFLILLLILLLSVPLLLPFIQPGYLQTHDGGWAVVRLGAMHRALIDDHLPVRWSGNLNFGYGYPLFLFTYPFPYYLGELFVILGFGLINSIKIVFVLATLLSAAFMFVLTRKLYGLTGAFISTVLYLYAPYRLVDLYVRGSIGEVMSFLLFPLLFYLLLKLFDEKKFFYVPLFSLSYGILLLTHNVMALLFSPFLLLFSIYLYFQTSRKQRPLVAIYVSFAFVLGILLSSFFLIPALIEKNNIVLSQVDLADITKNFATIEKLIIPYWNYGPFASSDGFSIQLGVSHIIALLLSLLILIKFLSNKLYHKTSLIFILFFMISIALLFPISEPFWRYIPLYSNVDFPWRSLGPAIFFMCLIFGILGLHKYLKIVGVFTALTSILIATPYISPKSYTYLPDSYYFTNEATTTSSDELMPIWVKEKPVERFSQKVELVEGDGILGFDNYNNKTLISVEASEDSKIRVNTIYFPGWNAYIEGEKVPINYDNKNGVIEFDIVKGKHIIDLRFEETPLRLVADFISLFTLVSCVLIIALHKRVEKVLIKF